MQSLPINSVHYEQLLTDYQQWLQTLGYADPTLITWPSHVRELLHFLESKNILHLTLVKSMHLKDFLFYIKHRPNATREGALSSSTINTIINAVNNFSRYVNSTGRYVLDFMPERLENDASIPTVLTVQEVRELYEATFMPQRENPVAMGQRDRAMLAIFYGCGLRKMEGTMLDITDIDLNKRLLFVRKGKGNKQRYVPIAAKHVEDIRRYLEEGREWFLHQHYARDYNRKYPQKKKAPDYGAFFIGQHGERMKRFYQRLEYLKEKAGIEKEFGLHTLRHSIATHLSMSGMAIEEIARFLGHSTLDATQIYVHLAHELQNQ